MATLPRLLYSCSLMTASRSDGQELFVFTVYIKTVMFLSLTYPCEYHICVNIISTLYIEHSNTWTCLLILFMCTGASVLIVHFN